MALVIATLAGADARAQSDLFVAVATSPPPTWSFEAAETGYYGLGWHEQSGHDAGQEHVANRLLGHERIDDQHR